MAVKIKIDPTRIYTAFTSFAAPAGTIRKGDRLRGDNPIVLAAPGLFHEDGLDDNQIHDLWRERFGLVVR